jgi:hypothetical protein
VGVLFPLNYTTNFQRILAPLINFFDYRRYLRAARYTIPLIKQRLSAPVSDDKKKVSAYFLRRI